MYPDQQVPGYALSAVPHAPAAVLLGKWAFRLEALDKQMSGGGGGGGAGNIALFKRATPLVQVLDVLPPIIA